MSTRYASLGTGLRRSPKTSVIQPWFRRCRADYVANQNANATYGTTAHTKGAWVQVHSSTPSASSLLYFGSAQIGVSSTDTSTLVDIGVGAAGSETVIVPNLAIGGWQQGANVLIPVAIPSGSRVAVRLQGSRTSPTAPSGGNSVALTNSLDYALTPTSVDVLGINTATSSATALTGASGSWTEITASTAKDYQTVIIVPSTSSTVTSNITVVMTLGIGASGSEVAISSLQNRYNASTQWLNNFNQPLWFSGPVPAGSRLSVRHDIASNPGRYNVCLIGVPYV